MWKAILSWSEVWTLLIPIAAWAFRRRQPPYMQPVTRYLFIALCINLVCDIVPQLSLRYYDRANPQWWLSNTPLYNLHSLVRFWLMSEFFLRLSFFDRRWVKAVRIAFAAGLIMIWLFSNETLWSVEAISGSQFSLEAFLLLILCMVYYLRLLSGDETRFTSIKSFWVVTGVATYCVTNFFVFLFYNPLLSSDIVIALRIWRIHNVAYIIWSIFIAIAYYVPAGDNH